MDFYQLGSATLNPTIGSALKSIRGTNIETVAKSATERCSNCKFHSPIRDGFGKCLLWERIAKRPVLEHENWWCPHFKPKTRVGALGSPAYLNAYESDARSVVPGEAPWSKRGEYGNNVVLQQGGKPFATFNFGNNVKTTLQEGSHLPISDIFRFKNHGEKNANCPKCGGGVWTIEATTDVTDGYFDNMLKQAGYQFRFTMIPQVWSTKPLLVNWTATDEALYNEARSTIQKVRRNVVRQGHDEVPAGRVTDLSGALFADVERPPFAKEGTENHRITRRIVFKVRCRHG